MGNYLSGTAYLGDLAGFAVSTHHLKVPTGGFEKLILDEDSEGGTNTNNHARHTSESIWNRVPLVVRGPILSEKFHVSFFHADPYQFWVVNVDQVWFYLLLSSFVILQPQSQNSRKRGSSNRPEEDPLKVKNIIALLSVRVLAPICCL